MIPDIADPECDVKKLFCDFLDFNFGKPPEKGRYCFCLWDVCFWLAEDFADPKFRSEPVHQLIDAWLLAGLIVDFENHMSDAHYWEVVIHRDCMDMIGSGVVFGEEDL